MEALSSRIRRFTGNGDRGAVLDEGAADDAAALAAHAGRTGWTAEFLYTLGWFHWFRCVALEDASGPDFRLAVQMFSALRELMPGTFREHVPEQLLPLFEEEGQEEEDPGALLQEALRRNNEATDLIARYERTGQLLALTAGIEMLRTAADLLRRVSGQPELIEINLVRALLMLHRATGDPRVLEQAVTLSGHAIDGLGQPRTGRMLTPLGANLLDAHLHTHDRRLFDLGVRALTHAHDAHEPGDAHDPDGDGAQSTAGADPEVLDEIRFRLAGALLIEFRRTGEAGAEEDAARYLGLLAARDGTDDAARTRRLEACASVVRHLPLPAHGLALLDARIAVLRALVGSRPAEAESAGDDTPRVEHLTDLGTCLRYRHTVTGEAAPLAEALDVLREAVAATADGDPAAPRRLISLANALVARSRAAEPDLADEGVATARRALAAAPGSPLAMSSLGNALLQKYEHSFDTAAVEESARLNLAAADALPENEPARHTALMNAAQSFMSVARATGGLAAVDQAVACLRRARTHRAPDEAVRAAVLVDLGEALVSRADMADDLAALDEGTDLLRSVSARLPADHPEYVRARLRLIRAYRLRHERTGASEVLEDALALSRSCLAHPGPAGPERAQLLAASSRTLFAMFAHTGDRTLLDEALPICRAAVDATPEGSPARADALLTLGHGLVRLYEVSRDSTALLEGADALELAAAHPLEWPVARAALTGLVDARRLHARRFVSFMGSVRRHYRNEPGPLGDLTRQYEDELDAVVDAGRRAVAAYPPDDPDRGAALCNLALALESRADFHRNGVDRPRAGRGPADPDSADREPGAPESADRGPAGSDEPAGSDRAAAPLRESADRGAADRDAPADAAGAADLDEAVALLREGVAGGPPDHEQRPVWLTDLSVLLRRLHRSRATAGRPADAALLDEAVELARRAADTARPGSSAHARANGAWAAALTARHPGERAVAAVAGDLYLQVARAEGSGVPDRIAAARNAADLAAGSGDWAAAAAAYEQAVALLPRLAGHQLGLSDREEALADHILLASDAAACALHLSDPGRALRLLERGRGILLGQAAEVRQDVTRLRRRSADLADRFARLSRELADVPVADAVRSPSALGPRMDRHRSRVREWERVCEEIRALPGFESFLEPEAPDVAALSRNGPVVVVNLSRYRCDALALVEGEVRVVPLPDVEFEPTLRRCLAFLDAASALHDPDLPPEDRWQAGLDVHETLGWLWDAVAGPVLGRLDLAESAGAGRPTGLADPAGLPRLWWCPTGVLSFFPLHAAGHYTGDATCSAADHVVSSYTATLGALRRPESGRARPGGPHDLLLVSAPDVPGHPPLPHAREEAGALARLLPGTTVLAGKAATRAAVLEALPRHAWAHFSCHATTSVLRQSANHLVLTDGHLSMSDVVTLPLDAELAFLAACGTASGSVQLADEAQHVASSFQLAGYAHVIATLWEVADDDAGRTVLRMYETMRAGAAPARAVHSVTGELRARYPRSPWLWAPYAHIGP